MALQPLLERWHGGRAVVTTVHTSNKLQLKSLTSNMSYSIYNSPTITPHVSHEMAFLFVIFHHTNISHMKRYLSVFLSNITLYHNLVDQFLSHTNLRNITQQDHIRHVEAVTSTSTLPYKILTVEGIWVQLNSLHHNIRRVGCDCHGGGLGGLEVYHRTSIPPATQVYLGHQSQYIFCHPCIYTHCKRSVHCADKAYHM